MKNATCSQRFKTLSISNHFIKPFLLIVLLINSIHSINSQEKVNIKDKNTNPISKNKFDSTIDENFLIRKEMRKRFPSDIDRRGIHPSNLFLEEKHENKTTTIEHRSSTVQSSMIPTFNNSNFTSNTLKEKEGRQGIRFSGKTNTDGSKVLDSIIFYNYTDRSLNDSIPALKYFYSFDSFNNRTLREVYRWDDTTNDWKGYSKNVWSYDSNNNRILEEYYRWDDTTNDWKGNRKEVYTYDSNNNRTLEKVYSWDDTTNDWNYYFKSVFSYDSNNNRTLEKDYRWDDTTNDWKDYSKSVFSYNSINNQTLREVYRWDDTTNDWKGNRKEVNTYDSNNNETLNERYSWDDTTNDWKGYIQYVYTYDSNNYRILRDSYNWDDTTTDWYKERTGIFYYSNSLPTDITLSNSSTDENLTIGTEIGTFTSIDEDTEDIHTHTLISGDGDTDNGSFTITENKLLTGESFDFETKPSYSVRVQTDDGNGGVFSKSFTISVIDVNESSTEITLSGSTIDENSSIGTEIGTLSSTDQDTEDTHTYSLVSGDGDTDNGTFTITGGKLLSGESFDFETKPSYSVRVQTNDGNGGVFSKSFTISVIDVNEDIDSDGIMNDVDACPNTPTGEFVNSTGCSESQIDTDGDEVMDDVDTCPNTPTGETVNSTGCSTSQIDTDGDGIMNDVDACPNTPTGEFVNSTGCSENQLSVDNEILDKSLKLYPNPLDNVLTIISKNVTVFKVEIYSVLGKKIKDVHSDFKTIRTDNLSNGLYLIKIYSEKGMVMKKIYKR